MADDQGAAAGAAMNAAVFANSSRALHLWTRSTGFRTHGLHYRCVGHAGLPRVGDEFLMNTRFSRTDRETGASIQSYFFDPTVVMLSMLGREDPGGGEAVALPESVALRRELGDLLARRRSERLYTGDPVELRYLATLLRAAAAVTAEATVDLASGDEARVRFRTAPSGGGLYPVELYAVALRVRGLPRAPYRYDPLRDVLLRTGDEAGVTALLGALAAPDELISVTRAAAVLVLVGRPWRSMRKYGPRGARFVMIEAGMMSENLHLAAQALGLGTVDCASLYDDEVHEAMGLDGVFQTLVHAVVVGYPGAA